MIYKNITEIKANLKNPRIIKDDKFAKLVQSLKDFPEMLEKRPLVCFTDTDSKLVVLGGNMRLQAAKQLGLVKLPVILADDWTEEQKAQFLIKDNVGFGEWNFDELANEWDETTLAEWGLDLVVKQNWDKLDYIDEAERPDFRKDNVITIVVPDEWVAEIKEIEQLVKDTLTDKYSGCEIK